MLNGILKKITAVKHMEKNLILLNMTNTLSFSSMSNGAPLRNEYTEKFLLYLTSSGLLKAPFIYESKEIRNMSMLTQSYFYRIKEKGDMQLP